MASNQFLTRKSKDENDFWSMFWEAAGENVSCDYCYFRVKCRHSNDIETMGCGEFLEKKYCDYLGVEDE